MVKDDPKILQGQPSKVIIDDDELGRKSQPVPMTPVRPEAQKEALQTKPQLSVPEASRQIQTEAHQRENPIKDEISEKAQKSQQSNQQSPQQQPPVVSTQSKSPERPAEAKKEHFVSLKSISPVRQPEKAPAQKAPEPQNPKSNVQQDPIPPAKIEVKPTEKPQPQQAKPKVDALKVETNNLNKSQDTPPVQMTSASSNVKLNKTYYTTRFNEQGVLEGYHPEKQFIIPVNTEIRFYIDNGLKIATNARLLVNKPKVNSKTGAIEYTITQPLSWNDEQALTYEGSALDTIYLEIYDADKEMSKYSKCFRVPFTQSGSFFVQIVYEDPAAPEGENYTKPMYINVDPQLTINGEKIECKQLSLMTVMSRQLGKIQRWPQVLQNAAELGYNAIHFTPFQVYGESFSHYSIADQTEVDDYFFEGKVDKMTKQRVLEKTLSQIRDKGLLSIVDIVLNHTANNSKWIRDHPSATYNTDDCPHLWSAWLLDDAIMKFSLAYSKKQVPECPSAPYIGNEGDLATVLEVLRKKIIEPLKLHEFFLCDVPKVMREDFIPAIQNIESYKSQEIKAKFEKENLFLKPRFEALSEHLTVGFGGKERMGVKLKMPEAAVYFMIVNNRNKDNAMKEVEKLLCQLNDHWMAKATGFLKEAMNALEGNIRYFKIEQKKSQITAINRIVDPYFTEMENAQKSKVAHNGWIMGHNCMDDFGIVGFHYLRRTINVWGDCVKLRYGTCPADSPYLWKHMTEYVQSMASIADGFRLDNTHTTPVHVCQYLLQAARTKNPNLFVMAELFTSSAKLDAMFCQQLNLNGLVRELQNRFDTKSTGDYFHSITCRDAVLGIIDEQFIDIKDIPYKKLVSKKPEDIIYDCTHDNPSVVDKFQTGRIALPHIGLNCMADKAIATTWGYDQLVHKQIHCVEEKRLYPIEDQKSFVRNIMEGSEKVEQAKNDQPIELPEQQFVEPQPLTYDINVSFAAGSVHVAHSFNGWKPDIAMNKTGGNNWQVTLTLPNHASGQKLYYKFILDGKNWKFSGDLPQEKDGSGNVNNVANLPNINASAPVSVPSSSGKFTARATNISAGAPQQRTFDDIRYARCLLNQVHEHCTRSNASIFLHQQAEDVLVVTRQLEMDEYADFDSYVSITRFCFFNKAGDYNYKQSIELPGFMSEVVFAGYLEIPDEVYKDPKLSSNKEGDLITGPKGCKLQSFNQIEGKFCSREKISEQNEKLNFHFMPPSFTCILRVKSRSFVKEAVQKLNQIGKDPRVKKLFIGTPNSGLNHVLFRCDQEERDISKGARGTYGLKNFGLFPYAGLSSFMFKLKQIKVSKDMGDELFDNIREGNWYIDYTLDRIKSYQAQEPDIKLDKVAAWLQENFDAVKRLPTFLKPKYVSRVIETVYNSAVREIMTNRILDRYMADSDDPFVQAMALAIYQYWGRIPSVYFGGFKDTMCAGLPHFSTGYMRCWGRDTFIALRGLLITPGFDQEARDTILFFAKVYRHGLLPNLHDGGNNTRFNSRDAPWFFLQAIKDYCLLSDEGTKFLEQTFELHFRDDDRNQHLRKTHGRTLSVLDLIIEIVQRHCQGIEFREWNAGTAIDAHMKSEGFNVKIHCDLENTGFCFGGNKDNCGTWMDKMGSSDITGNRGVPATPRDGAPIELVAMQYSILSWLGDLKQKGVIKYGGITVNRAGQDLKVDFMEWALKMRDNFERCFWIPQNKNEDHLHQINSKMVNRRGIYKDVYGSSSGYADYQLRSNIPIAMSYAPELFDPEHARICIQNIASILMEANCMGIKTLDPSDRQYNGDYINSDNSHGWNYHQGPEWVWPVGFFLKAQLQFINFKSVQEAKSETMKYLIPHRVHIETDKWMGLPELTNSHGKRCNDSCTTQAWSVATINDAMRDLYNFEAKH